MSRHVIARDDLDQSLLKLVRGGGRIDSMYLDPETDEWVVITEDRIETRSTTVAVKYPDGSVDHMRIVR